MNMEKNEQKEILKEMNNTKEFKKMSDLTLEEIKKWPTCVATVRRIKNTRTNVERYYFILHLVKGWCDFTLNLSQQQYYNILIKANEDFDTKESDVKVFTRYSIGQKKDGEKYHLIEVVVNKLVRFCFFVDDLQIENLKELKVYNTIPWENRGQINEEDGLVKIQSDME